MATKKECTCDYGYFSKLLQKPFDTVEELVAAEDEYNKAHEAEIKAAEEKKSMAKAVEDAYKHYIAVSEEVSKVLAEARDAYLQKRAEFINKYHSYHMSYYQDDTNTELLINDIWSTLADIFK